MDSTTKSYQIVLPKGEADRPFLELSQDEVQEVGRKVFAMVKERARKAGVVPITTQTVSGTNS